MVSPRPSCVRSVPPMLGVVEAMERVSTIRPRSQSGKNTRLGLSCLQLPLLVYLQSAQRFLWPRFNPSLVILRAQIAKDVLEELHVAIEFTFGINGTSQVSSTLHLHHSPGGVAVAVLSPHYFRACCRHLSKQRSNHGCRSTSVQELRQLPICKGC
jgi:hypothetical protein